MNQYARAARNVPEPLPERDGPCPAATTRCRPPTSLKLARAIIREFPEYYRWYSQREFTWNKIRQENRNGLLDRDPSVDGMKTGMTDAAGYCLVSSAKRDGMRLIAVVTGTKSMKAREDASLALLNYGFNFYETRVLKKAGAELAGPTRLQGARQPCSGRRRRGPRGHAAAWPGGQSRRAPDGTRAEGLRAADEGRPRRHASRQRSTARSSPSAAAAAGGRPRGSIFRRIWDTILSWFG